jgi:hypothetical protein
MDCKVSWLPGDQDVTQSVWYQEICIYNHVMCGRKSLRVSEST